MNRIHLYFRVPQLLREVNGKHVKGSFGSIVREAFCVSSFLVLLIVQRKRPENAGRSDVINELLRAMDSSLPLIGFSVLTLRVRSARCLRCSILLTCTLFGSEKIMHADFMYDHRAKAE